MRLNLGAGNWRLDGYENWDRATGQEAYPLGLADGSVSELRCSHILEHFSHTVRMDVLRDWVRVLEPGGTLKVAVPDFEKCIGFYRAEDRLAEAYIMGGHVDENDRHGAIFNEKSLAAALREVGLIDIEGWSDVADCSSLPVSLNLMGRKPGELRARTEAAELPKANGPFDWLKSKLSNTYSQQGEDGVVEAIFTRLGIEKGFLIEVGAGDPVQYSNSLKLIEEGWSALLIEGDHEKFLRLRDRHHGKPSIFIDNEIIEPSGPRSLDALLELYGAPEDPDLLVLDIDGQDYYCWNGLLKYSPKIVICEFDPQEDPRFIPQLGGGGQAGAEAIQLLAIGKCYAPLVQVGTNIVFARNDYARKLADGPFQAAANPSAGVHIDASKVKAIMTLPRLAFTDNMFCCMNVLQPLGIAIERRGGAFWGQGLTKLMEGHLDDGTEYLLTIDYDTVFEKSDVLELLRLMVQRPEIDAVCGLQMKRASSTPLFCFGMETPKAGETRSVSNLAEALSEEAMQIQTGHFGLTVIRVEALRRAKRPWFVGVPDENGGWGDGRIDDDIYFWHNWEQSGNTLYLANRVALGHIQQVVSWPSRKLELLNQFCSDYVDNGKPSEVWR